MSEQIRSKSNLSTQISSPRTLEKRVTSLLIDGATGYVGSHVSHVLSGQGFAVRCLVRASTNPENVDMLKSCQLEIYQADLLTPSSSLDQAFDGAEVAIHLIGSIAPRRGETLAELHVAQTERFVQMCLKGGVKKVIMVSALGACADAQSQYHRTKWLAQEVLRSSGLPTIILAPSLIIGRTFGHRDSKLVNRMRHLIETKKRVPILGSGQNKIQPIFIDDLVAAISHCVSNYRANTGKLAPLLQLGGSEIITMNQFVQALIRSMGYQRQLIHIPIGVAQVLALAAEKFQEVPIISRDQVKLSMIDNVCLVNQLTSDLGIVGTLVTDALKSYTNDART